MKKIRRWSSVKDCALNCYPIRKIQPRRFYEVQLTLKISPRVFKIEVSGRVVVLYVDFY